MYEPVIGLEIHIQGKTKSKMFCTCAADYFGAEPNTNVCPVCLGLPGALPVPNKAAVELAVKLGLALNCEINQYSKFDRKNYFYPDLPKAYQISQYDLPFAINGYLEIETSKGKKKIRIRRVHLEEDTGKSIHEGDNTYLDYNKSGVPLLEVVTEPDFEALEEVTLFSKLLRQTVIYSGASLAEMQKGQMRFELNLSVRTNEPADELPNYRVEVKNIGSISVLEKVIQFEAARQQEILSSGGKVTNETRGLRDMTGETVSQRVKETENDYRYFPEPDIPPIRISDEWLSSLRQQLPELPQARVARYESIGIARDAAEILMEQREKGDWLDNLTKDSSDNKITVEAAKFLVGEISGLLDKAGTPFVENPVKHEDLLFLATQVIGGQISSSTAKAVIGKIFSGEGSAQQIVEKEGLAQVNDESQIRAWVDQVIADNQQIVASIAKNPSAVKALMGKVMALSQGKANPSLVSSLLTEKFPFQ